MAATFNDVAAQHVTETLQSMFAIEPKATGSSVSGKGKLRDGVCAVIGINGDVSGQIGVYASPSVAMHLTGAMLGEMPTSINEDVLDAIGELANILSGQTKNTFNAKGVTFEISVPTIIEGRAMKVQPAKGMEWNVVSFEVEGGDFEYLHCLKRNGG